MAFAHTEHRLGTRVDALSRAESAARRQNNLIIRHHAKTVTLIQLDNLAPDNLVSVAPAAFLMLQTSPSEKEGWQSRQDAPGMPLCRKGLNAMKKKLPSLLTDEAAEDFVATADLTDYDLSGMTPMRFEFQPKDRRITLRLSESLFEAIREAAERSTMPCLNSPRATSSWPALKWGTAFAGTDTDLPVMELRPMRGGR